MKIFCIIFFVFISLLNSEAQIISFEYLHNKYDADSLFKTGNYQEAIKKYKVCLKTDDWRRSDYYYLSACYANLNKLDSAYYLRKKAIDLGSHYNKLQDTLFFQTDDNFINLRKHKSWDSLNKAIIENTVEYFENYMSDTGLINELLLRHELDQRYRQEDNFHDSISKIMRKQIDASNTLWLDSIISVRKSWFKRQEVGNEGLMAAFLILQHAQDLEFQKICLLYMKELYFSSEVDVYQIAYLQDRILDKEGKLQIFGSQYDFDGNMLPVQDSMNLEKRRVAIGLPSLYETNKAIEDYKNKQVKE